MPTPQNVAAVAAVETIRDAIKILEAAHLISSEEDTITPAQHIELDNRIWNAIALAKNARDRVIALAEEL